MLEKGIRGTQTVMVDESNTAKTMGSGTLQVFATPAMTALMEKTAWMSVSEYLEEGSILCLVYHGKSSAAIPPCLSFCSGL